MAAIYLKYWDRRHLTVTGKNGSLSNTKFLYQTRSQTTLTGGGQSFRGGGAIVRCFYCCCATIIMDGE